MKKILSLFFACAFMIFACAGCGNSQTTADNGQTAQSQESTKDTDSKVVKIAVPDGLPAMAAAKLIKETPDIKENVKTEYTIEKSADSLATSVMKGEPDIAIVPSNLAASVYNKNKNYKIAGTAGWGSFYIGTTDSSVNTIEDLKGKEVYNIGKGLTPDITAKAVFEEKGIDPEKDINFSYVDGVSELAPLILSGKAQYAVIPEPALSTVQSKNPDFKIIAGLNDEWKKADNSEFGYPQSTVIIKEDLIKDNKEFAEAFIEKMKESTSWAVENPDDLAVYCSEIGVSADKSIIPKAVSKSGLNFVPVKECREEYKKYFEKLNEKDAKTIGGQIPDEEIYME